jgi:hypothetical protein
MDYPHIAKVLDGGATDYRLRKFLRRNKRPVLAAGLVALTLVGGTWCVSTARGRRSSTALGSPRRHNR